MTSLLTCQLKQDYEGHCLYICSVHFCAVLVSREVLKLIFGTLSVQFKVNNNVPRRLIATTNHAFSYYAQCSAH